MQSSSERAGRSFQFLLILAALLTFISLPILYSAQKTSANTILPPQSSLSTTLDAERQAALRKLGAQLKAGEIFSLEEKYILDRFSGGEAITELEADTLISRALYAQYIAYANLTGRQEELLGAYANFVQRQHRVVLDYKYLFHQNRKARAKNNPPPAAPLVAPANDNCSTAEIIPAAGPFPYATAVTADITDATSTGDPTKPACIGGVVSRSIWYRFTPSTSGLYNISSCASDGSATTVDDNAIAVYTSSGGCAGPFTLVACDDDTCSDATFLHAAVRGVSLTAGTTYYIIVWKVDLTTPQPPSPGETAVQLIVQSVTVPANNTCAAPTVLSLNLPTSGSTQGATNDYELSGLACFTGIGQTASVGFGGDVVYSFTAPTANKYSFKVTNYNSGNLVMYMASSCPAATPGTPVTVSTCVAAANRNSTELSEEVLCQTLTAGQVVYIFVDEDSTTIGGSFTIEVITCTEETEPNDTPATAGAFTNFIEGSANTTTDVDFYSLGTPAAGSRLFAMIDGSGANGNNFDMRVTTATDTLQFDDSSNAPLFGSASPNIAGRVLPNAPCYLRVSYGNTLQAQPYRLYATIRTGTPVAETEPNNTPAQANSAASNYFSGTLPAPSPSSDNDFYSFSANAGDLFFVSLDGDPTRDGTPIDAALDIVNSSSNVLLTVDDENTASDNTATTGNLAAVTPFSPSEGLLFKASTSGTFYVKVRITDFTLIDPSTGAGDYILSIVRITAGPTAVQMSDFDAANQQRVSVYDNGALVQWRTGYEVDNLGFNVYREENGKRVLVTPQLLAGSALLAGQGTAMTAGRSYAWFDKTAPRGALPTYWVEDIDLNGRATMHGPIRAGSANAGKTLSLQAEQQAITLSRLAYQQDAAQGDTSAPTVRKAKPGKFTAERITTQSNLANQNAVKLSIKQEGFYRITQAELLAAGLSAKADPRTLQLFADGVEQAIQVRGEGDGVFDAGDAVEFYGLGVDLPSTDTRVYWLVAGNQPGRRMPRASGNLGQPLQSSFPFTVERADKLIYFPSLKNGDKENFFGAIVTASAVDQSLRVKNLSRNPVSGATLDVKLQGVSLSSHRVGVQINNANVGEVSFDGQNEGLARLQIPSSILNEGENVVRLTSRNGASDVSLVARLALTCPHTYTVDSNQLNLTASGGTTVNLDGFTGKNVRVFDVTSAAAVQEIAVTVSEGKAGFSAAFAVPNTGQRTLLALTDNQAQPVASAVFNQPSSWQQASNTADLVILTRREFFAAIEPLRALRQSEGLAVAVVDIDDVYDEFSYGQKLPHAIKDFVTYAMQSWTRAPRYLLLIGDASFDPRNYLEQGDSDLLPTRLVDTAFLETANDDWFADANGDNLPDIAVGRLPAKDAGEVARLIAKIVNYDSSMANSVLLVSDVSDTYNFEAASAALKDLLPRDLRAQEVRRGQTDLATARAQLFNAINQGQKIVNYVGHGSIDLWRGGLLTGSDARNLSNRNRLPFFVMMNCLNGYFQDATADSLAESLLKAERGGAVAVWASAALCEAGGQATMNRELYRALFTERLVRLGDAVKSAKRAVTDNDIRRSWILFGDPTMRISK